MTGMKRLIGMPVICEGKHIGSIVRGVLRSDGKALRGLVMRDGLRLSRWIDIRLPHCTRWGHLQGHH